MGLYFGIYEGLAWTQDMCLPQWRGFPINFGDPGYINCHCQGVCYELSKSPAEQRMTVQCLIFARALGGRRCLTVFTVYGVCAWLYVFCELLELVSVQWFWSAVSVPLGFRISVVIFNSNRSNPET